MDFIQLQNKQIRISVLQQISIKQKEFDKMKWKSNSKVPESTRQRIELMINNFDAFIRQTHGNSENEQDDRVFKDWKQFKQQLDNNPDDMQSHQEHVSKMSDITKSRQSRNTNQGLKKTSSQLNLVKSVMERKKSRDYQIDKEKLRTSIHAFMSILERNNREILKI